MTLANLAIHGQGIAILPTYVGDRTSSLQEVSGAIPELTVPIWVARHIDAKVTLQMKEVQSKLTTYLEESMKKG